MEKSLYLKKTCGQGIIINILSFFFINNKYEICQYPPLVHVNGMAYRFMHCLSRGSKNLNEIPKNKYRFGLHVTTCTYISLSSMQTERPILLDHTKRGGNE